MLKETWNYTWPEYFWKLFSEADMAYNATAFWIVLPIFLGIYLLLRNQTAKRVWILFGSIIFYIWSGPAALAIVLGTSLIIYGITRRIDGIYSKYDVEKDGLSPKEQAVLFACYKKKTLKYVWLALVLILGIWIAVKVGKLLEFDTVETFVEMFSGTGIIVPLGISYYTLSSVGYLMDVYWRKTKPEKNILNLISAMIYFPHIMQGPISKYQDLISQMKNLPSVEYNRVCYGLQLMVWGYIKKMVIADRLVLYTATVFATPKDFAGVEVLIAVILCTIQLYADFSGCMDIVRGISQVLGIELAENFRQPFFAKSAQEFWARWHITLGTWTKDYIYLPIAMNPKFMKCTRTLKKSGKAWLSSFLKAFCPLITVWIFTGLWHGTGIDYLAWGLYWCTIMTLSKELEPLGKKMVGKLRINTEAVYYRKWMSIRTVMFFGIGR
ncbi:MAG: MBOAT family O-acyltransferase, partial [Eubacteriales bacterium]